MEKVESQSKNYELISLKHDPVYNQLLDVIPLVKQFIKEKHLIIYGGTAIDFALRLKGDFIYPDESLAVPDLDFYSPDNVAHAYEFADVLFRRGYKDVRAIRALYVRTMRVDIGGSHFIADITYVPPEIFEKLPTLEYESMRIIHPDFQRIDLHSSMAFPFDNPPREVIFARWKKDIERFNKLDKLYPIKFKKQLKLKYFKVNRDHIGAMPLSGVGSYAAIYMSAVALAKKFKVKLPEDIVEAEIRFHGEEIELPYLGNTKSIDVVSNQPNLTGRHFEAYITIIPKYTLQEFPDYSVRVFSTEHRLIGVCRELFGKNEIIFTNIQFMLGILIGYSHVEKINKNDELSEGYIALYDSMLKIIDFAANIFADTQDVELAIASPFYPKIETFGGPNYNESYEIIFNSILADLGYTSGLRLPVNYFPCRGNTPQKFDYNSSPYFRKSGGELASPSSAGP